VCKVQKYKDIGAIFKSSRYAGAHPRNTPDPPLHARPNNGRVQFDLLEECKCLCCRIKYELKTSCLIEE